MEKRRSTDDYNTEPSPEETALDGQSGRSDAAPTSAFRALGWLDRFLAVWIFLAMVVGILLGNFVSDVGPALQKGKFVGVSVPIAVGLLVMMYPILCKVRYESLHAIFAHRGVWRQIGFSLIVNWIVAPFFMVCSLVVVMHLILNRQRLTCCSLPLHGRSSPTKATCGRD